MLSGHQIAQQLLRGRGEEPVRYVYVRWIHDLEDEPVGIYSELDDGWEVRKIEVYSDGRMQHAGPDGATGDTVLSEMPIPDLSQVNADPQFEGREISRSEFGRIWEAAQG